MATDGPFAEVKEHLAGFYLVECAAMERAVEIAARVPDAACGQVEVRPVLDLAAASVSGRDRVEELLRELAPQVLGALVRRYGDFDTCEDAVQEALLAAATQWPADGVPANPTGWLITVASRRRIELWRSDDRPPAPGGDRRRADAAEPAPASGGRTTR